VPEGLDVEVPVSNAAIAISRMTTATNMFLLSCDGLAGDIEIVLDSTEHHLPEA
jgi:hypothetical protein